MMDIQYLGRILIVLFVLVLIAMLAVKLSGVI